MAKVEIWKTRFKNRFELIPGGIAPVDFPTTSKLIDPQIKPDRAACPSIEPGRRALAKQEAEFKVNL